MPGATRGFLGRARRPRDERLPPGQYDAGADWPVLTAEVTPHLVPERWTMTVDGLVGNPTTWSWDEMHALPQSEYAGDIHCVTTWSKLGTSFAGVSVDVLLDAARPRREATFLLATPPTGYTTTLPLEDVRDGKAWIAWSHEGQPLTAEHGGPLRLPGPHLDFLESGTWVTPLTSGDPPSSARCSTRRPTPCCSGSRYRTGSTTCRASTTSSGCRQTTATSPSG